MDKEITVVEQHPSVVVIALDLQRRSAIGNLEGTFDMLDYGTNMSRVATTGNDKSIRDAQ